MAVTFSKKAIDTKWQWYFSSKSLNENCSLIKSTSLVAQTVKHSAYNAGGPGLIPGLGRSPGEGNGNSLQYSCLENPMDGGTW